MFATLIRQPEGMRQRSYPVDLIYKVLNCLPTDLDSYLSQALFFRGTRRAVHLWSIGTLFVDLDIYNVPDFGPFRSPEEAASHVLVWLDGNGILPPSLVCHSGRGLYLKWLLTGGLPQAALPRWNAVQRELVARLEPIGADAAARDCSRVLRAERTVNTWVTDPDKRIVRVVRVTEDGKGQPIRYGFDDFADEILPFTREQMAEFRAMKKDRKWKQGDPARARYEAARQFNRSTLWHSRLNDLRLVCEMRGGIAEGKRERFLFLMVNAGRWAGLFDTRQAYREAVALAREIVPAGPLSWWMQSDISTIVKRDPSELYRFKNGTLIRWAGITESEQEKLATIIGQSEKYRRNNERRREKRGTKRKREERRARVRELHYSGQSLREIASALNMAVDTVRRDLELLY